MSEQHMDGTVAVDASCGKAGFLVLLRHGQTFWSESGQHTGRTNIPLTEVGRQQAMDAGARLREAFPEGFDPECVFSSPLKRACQTAELAGFAQHGILDGIAEWDYGRAEGRTRQQVSDLLRILTSQGLNVDPQCARLLRLDTAHYSVLSVYKGDNVIERWNA